MEEEYMMNNIKRRKRRRILPLFYFISSLCCLFSIYSLLSTITTTTTTTTTPYLDIRNPSGVSNEDSSSYFQGFGKMKEENSEISSSIRRIKSNEFGFEFGFGFTFIHRRFLSVPGSSPPRCTSKCGNCRPCKPVHVPVPPGTPVTTEYYPEAWRCKCGNRLYMP